MTNRTASHPATPTRPDLDRRSAGVLLHLTSVPGPPHCGDLGRHALDTATWLRKAGQTWWQMLPVNPVGDGDSPYSTVSSFASEPLLVDLEGLVKEGWLKKGDLQPPRSAAVSRVDFAAARAFRGTRLRQAYTKARATLGRREDFRDFQQRNAGWLGDYACFIVLAGRFGTRDWSQWPAELRARKPDVLAAVAAELAEEILYLEFVQWRLDHDWRRLRAHAAELGLGLIGDLPIFVSHGSADVWANPGIFRLDAQGRPTVVAGCPPDAFNEDGQLWGNALYDWEELKAQDYAWWLARFDRLLEQFDAVRLDHFIGFHRYWEIAAGARNARGGTWRPADGDALFERASRHLGRAPFIAEDLGAVVAPVREMRDRYGFPGMKVLQFAFDGSAESDTHKPHLMPERSVVYTGTHDNDTTRGWYAALAKRARRDRKARAELGRIRVYLDTDERQVHWDMIRAAYGSRAAVAIVPAQDLLGLPSAGRMNTPGTPQGNWRWRLAPGQLSPSLQQRMADLTAAYDR